MGALRREQYDLFKAFANLRNAFAQNPDATLADNSGFTRKAVVAMDKDTALKMFDRSKGPTMEFSLLYIVVKYLDMTVQNHHFILEHKTMSKQFNNSVTEFVLRESMPPTGDPSD